MQKAQRENDLGEMSRLQYGVIPELEKQLAQDELVEEKEEPKLLRNKVTDNEIAEVVSAATGIPVAKMLQGEREKLLQMESFLHQRVVGQDEAVIAVSMRCAVHVPGCRIRTVQVVLSCSWVQPVSVRPS